MGIMLCADNVFYTIVFGSPIYLTPRMGDKDITQDKRSTIMINLSMMTEWFATLVSALFAGNTEQPKAVPSVEARFFESEIGDSH